jgi:hypothetical protein
VNARGQLKCSRKALIEKAAPAAAKEALNPPPVRASAEVASE